jgi:NAD(P)-dependent dehydrogenase (short-subunit alcohol dehydrogenase family)
LPRTIERTIEEGVIVPVEPRTLFSVAGKVAIITGGSGGIGTALVRGFAELGAMLLAVDIVEPKDLPSGVIFHHADIRDPDAIAGIATTAESRFGRVDVLINNAGLGEKYRAEDMPLPVWNNTLATNLTGSFLLSQAIGRGMIARRSGKIVNIASRCAFMGMPFSAAYNASKAGIVALTHTLAVEWAPHDIQVNAIVPGVVRTPMNAHRDDDPVEEQLFQRTIPLGRVSEPEDLLGAALFLSSSASAYITGAVLFVDGGNYMADGIGTLYRDHMTSRMGMPA